MRTPEFPVLPGCPWSSLIERFPPNVKWCEAPMCSWVSEPANTWSNLAYLLVGAFILLRAGRGSVRRTFGWAAIAVGTGSFIYHASTNLLTQFIDFLGMYIYALLPLLLNLRRLGVLRGPVVRTYLLCLSGLLALTPMLHAARVPIQLIVLGLVLSVLGTELRLSRREDSPAVDRRPFFLGLGLLTIGAVFSALDVSRAWCDPASHVLQGHAIWHVFTAAALLSTSRFYDKLAVPLR